MAASEYSFITNFYIFRLIVMLLFLKMITKFPEIQKKMFLERNVNILKKGEGLQYMQLYL